MIFAKEAELVLQQHTQTMKKGTISMINFIKVMRTFGRLEEPKTYFTKRRKIEKIEKQRVK